MAKEITDIIVENISDSQNSNSIKNAVGTLKGVQKVGVDLTNKKVSVEFDPEIVTGQNILHAIEDQGYNVTKKQ